MALPEYIKPKCDHGEQMEADWSGPICIRQRAYRHKNLSYYDACLKGKVGSDWKDVRSALFALWEVILFNLEFNLSSALSMVASFPFRIRLYHEASPNIWAEWTIQNMKELEGVLPYIMTEDKRSFILCQKDPSKNLEKKDLATWSNVRDIDCAISMVNKRQGWFYFVTGRFFFWLQKVPMPVVKTKHTYNRKPIPQPKFRYIASVNGITLVGEHFASQTEYIRYVLKRKGRTSKRQTFTKDEEFYYISSRDTDQTRRICPPGLFGEDRSPPGF